MTNSITCSIAPKQKHQLVYMWPSEENVSPAVIVNPHSWYPFTTHSINITSIFDRTHTLYMQQVPEASLKIEGIFFQELSTKIDDNRYNR